MWVSNAEKRKIYFKTDGIKWFVEHVKYQKIKINNCDALDFRKNCYNFALQTALQKPRFGVMRGGKQILY